MQSKKILVETINSVAEFPQILESLEAKLIEEKGEYILIVDASNFFHLDSLLNVTVPDLLLLNLKLSVETAIAITTPHLKNERRVTLGMITKAKSTYYTSLCSTLHSDYEIHKSIALRSMQDIFERQQLN